MKNGLPMELVWPEIYYNVPNEYPPVPKRGRDILEHVGFAFIDLNEDGTDELVLGIIDRNYFTMEDGYVYAIYTVIDGEVVFAIRGHDRCNFRIGNDGYLYYSWSGGWNIGGMHIYRFDPAYEDFLKPIELIGDHMFIEGNGRNDWYAHIRYDDDPALFDLCRNNYFGLPRAEP